MKRIKMIEHKNTIDILASQLDALLDLIQSSAENDVDGTSLAVAADMARTILNELEMETDDIVKEWKAVVEEKEQEAILTDAAIPEKVFGECKGE